MIFVGERINTGFKDIKQAVMDKDPKPLQRWARDQTAAGATYLDVNLGAVSTKPEDMCWMIETVQAAVDTPISIDSNKPAILAEAIKVCNKPPLINSSTASQEKMDVFLPIVVECGGSVIGLSMDDAGAPKSADMRVEKAGMFLATAMEHGITPDRVFLDPIVMPLKFMQDQAKEILEAARQFLLFSDPAPHIICGLSNVSNGTTHKKLINRIFLTMLINNGADAAICDVMDTDLVHAALTAELVMNREIYADSYI
ncbi:MAG: methyltetrahydrofolate--corrinoid methyltransferase [Lentisphaerales bacterium]|jgi:5-methyltetrahydrofolate corrinoid/iron sulfur protein methyltransferase|nr:MAG: methyltetrahydrofolate--corrinoid methyltransferase [Lentisphaerales bacterium]